MSRAYKWYFAAWVIVILLFAFVGASRSEPVVPQNPQAYTMAGTGPHTTCQTPATGAYYLCVATDGIWISNNGAAYFQLMPPAAAATGVTSLSVNGGTPLTGPVAITVPSTAVSTTTTTIH